MISESLVLICAKREEKFAFTQFVYLSADALPHKNIVYFEIRIKIMRLYHLYKIKSLVKIDYFYIYILLFASLFFSLIVRTHKIYKTYYNYHIKKGMSVIYLLFIIGKCK
jgi:hypothetical protein